MFKLKLLFNQYLTVANFSLLTLLIIIIDAAAERCSESKSALVCREMIAIHSKLRREIQLLRHHLTTEQIRCLENKYNFEKEDAKKTCPQLTKYKSE